MLFPTTSPPQTPPRVVITGAGIITALGLGWKPNAAGFRAGRTAFRPVTLFDVSRQRAKNAAEVDLPAALPSTRLSAKQIARFDRAASCCCWQLTKRGNNPAGNPRKICRWFWARPRAACPSARRIFDRPCKRHTITAINPPGPFITNRRFRRGWFLRPLGSSGPVTIVSNACASGSNAIGHAWELIRYGQAERVLTGGYDALTQLVFSGFDALQALSTTVCRPFDARRDGLALGEGAAILAIETHESARRRNATILGELIGYGTSIDQHHLTQPHPQGDTTLTVMKQACDTAGVTPDDIDYLNAHGTGTVLNDSSEAAAIGHWAGPRAATLPVSSTKANIGHLLGAAGAVEAVICLMTLREQWLPPETMFETPDPACNFSIVHKPRDARVNVVLSNSFGFGGVNASLIFRRWA